MITFSKHFVISFLTARNLSKNKGLKKFFEIFSIRFIFAFDFIRNFFNNQKNNYKNINSSKYFEENIESTKVIEDLKNFGYNNFLKLRKNYLELLKSEISLTNSKISFKGKKNSDKFGKTINFSDKLKDIFEKSKENEISHIALDIDLSKTNYIKEFATSEFLMNIAKNYIKSDKISISGQCYISNPVQISETEKKDNAQYFHYDNDFKKFFKVFIYLSDVNHSAGPHSFVAKTNTKKTFKHIIAERIDDLEITKFYDKESIKVFEGKEGNIIVEDTFGLHKGSPPINQSRIMLILIYGHGLGIDIYKNPLIKEYN